MGIVIAVGVFVVTILSAAISQLLADEFKAWVPLLVEAIVRRALSCAPEQHRERLGEEWRSHVGDVPGSVAKVVVAIGFIEASKMLWRDVAIKKASAPNLSPKERRMINKAYKTFQLLQIFEQQPQGRLSGAIARTLRKRFDRLIEQWVKMSNLPVRG